MNNSRLRGFAQIWRLTIGFGWQTWLNHIRSQQGLIHWYSRVGYRARMLLQCQASLCKSSGKCLYTRKTLLWVFCQRCQYNLLNFRRYIWYSAAQRWRRNKHMLAGNLSKCAVKRAVPTQPLVDDDA